ncbi:histone acetyltransferase [Pancytospora epiphaga]|nr:histone acetyltransferase [Pancytospora epiphaga]
MDIFGGRGISKLLCEEEMNKTFYTEKLYLKIVSTSDNSTSFDYLLRIKNLFQRMLPKMPKEYIMRQVFDAKHCSFVLNSRDGDIIGAVCYRPNFGRNFVEIVFLAIDSMYHIRGYGTFLFGCFKEVCKRQFEKYFKIGEKYKEKDVIIEDLEVLCRNSTVVADEATGLKTEVFGNTEDCKNANTKHDVSSPGAFSDSEQVIEYTKETNLYLLTYADNSAIGFFKKQGFTRHPVSSGWMGYIKDYDGGTLMEGKVYKQINYLNRSGLLRQMRNRIFEKMKDINDYHVMRSPDDIMIIKDKYKEECAAPLRTKENFLYDFIFYLISNLQSNSSAWPFLEPVDTTLVPDYLSVIDTPMDLSTIATKHKNSGYTTLRQLIDDVYLMSDNCLTYNDPSTPYYKCGLGIRDAFDRMILKYKGVINQWGYEC